MPVSESLGEKVRAYASSGTERRWFFDARDWGDLYKELSELALQLNFQNFAVVSIPAPTEIPSQLVLLTNWPERWHQAYVPYVLAHSEPVLNRLGTFSDVVYWCDIPRNLKSNTYFYRAEREGIDSAISAQALLPSGSRVVLTFSGALQSDSNSEESRLGPSVLWYANSLGRAVFEFAQRRSNAGNSQLTRREGAATLLAARGSSTAEIAEALSISERTVLYFLSRAAGKLNVSGRKKLAAKAHSSDILHSIYHDQGYQVAPPDVEVIDSKCLKSIRSPTAPINRKRKLLSSLGVKEEGRRSPSRMRDISALIIDDEDISRSILKRQLQRIGIGRILTASSGAEGIETAKLNSGSLDMIFLDLEMPEVDGLMAASGIASFGTPTLIPVTGHGNRIAKAACSFARALGYWAPGYLLKPVDPVAIGELVSNYLASPNADFPRPAPLSFAQVSKAISEKRIEIHYQPKICLKTGSLIGVEALARLRKQNGEVVFPREFISQIESRQSNLNQLTEYVSERAIRDLKRLSDVGHNLSLSFNLSYFGEEHEERISALILRTTKQCQLDPSRITIEVTENYLNSLPQLIIIAVRLRLAGFGLSMDDFGVQGSDIPRLKQIPFTEIKLDRSLVKGSAGDTDARDILHSMIGLARRLSMNVVAEGVESNEELAVLRDVQCDQAQGFLFSRALPFSELVKFCDRWIESNSIQKNRVV